VVEQPIRNRQVASSTLALGSNIPLEDKDLADSLDCLCPIRCKVVTNSEVFAQRIHRAHLRFIHALDVNVLSYPDVAVAKNRLDGFVVHAEVVKVCRDAPAKCVPSVARVGWWRRDAYGIARSSTNFNGRVRWLINRSVGRLAVIDNKCEASNVRA
jgi:hypothetical protein